VVEGVRGRGVSVFLYVLCFVCFFVSLECAFVKGSHA